MTSSTSHAVSHPITFRDLGHQAYLPVWEAMRSFTQTRTAACADEIWFVEHPPVFTQGQAGKPEHILNPQHIPVIPVDRGGQVTYHGPGQVVGYFLLDLRRRSLGVRDLVTAIEQAVITLLAHYQIKARARADAPGVYVQDDKICSLGLRIRKGCSYHGLALNVDMDLTPFTQINPCGLTNIRMTQIADLHQGCNFKQVQNQLANVLAQQLSGQTTAVECVTAPWDTAAPANKVATTRLNDFLSVTTHTTLETSS